MKRAVRKNSGEEHICASSVLMPRWKRVNRTWRQGKQCDFSGLSLWPTKWQTSPYPARFRRTLSCIRPRRPLSGPGGADVGNTGRAAILSCLANNFSSPALAPLAKASRPDQVVQVWQCPAASHAVAGRSSCHSPAGEQLPRQVRALHCPGSAQPRSAAQGAHRYYRQDGSRRARGHQERCRLPTLLRGDGARWENPSPWSREGADRDPVDNARVFHLDLYLVLKTIGAAVGTKSTDPFVRYGRELF